MKLLLDANISWRLCSFFSDNFGECIHVNKIGLTNPAKDAEIWQYAKDHNFIIITQDCDFINFIEVKGYPPKIILIKTGNINRKQMEEILIQAKQPIFELSDSEEYGLLEIL